MPELVRQKRFRLKAEYYPNTDYLMLAPTADDVTRPISKSEFVDEDDFLKDEYIEKVNQLWILWKDGNHINPFEEVEADGGARDTEKELEDIKGTIRRAYAWLDEYSDLRGLAYENLKDTHSEGMSDAAERIRGELEFRFRDILKEGDASG